MKKILLLLVSTILLGCGSNHRDYSVFDELDYETLSKAKNDSVFLEVYNLIEKDRHKLNNLSENIKNKFVSITYGELCEVYSKEYLSQDQIKQLEEEYQSLPSSVKTIYKSFYEYAMSKTLGKVGEFIILMGQLENL